MLRERAELGDHGQAAVADVVAVGAIGDLSRREHGGTEVAEVQRARRAMYRCQDESHTVDEEEVA